MDNRRSRKGRDRTYDWIVVVIISSFHSYLCFNSLKQEAKKKKKKDSKNNFKKKKKKVQNKKHKKNKKNREKISTGRFHTSQ